MTSNSNPAPLEGGLCPIVLGCDDGYGMPLATTLRSVVDANPHAWPIECYVLSDGITGKTQHKVIASLPEGSAVIHWVPVELSTFRQFSSPSYLSRIIFARLLVAEILPGEISRVLYLDTDLLVLQDLRPLCQADLGSFALGAVGDGFMDRATEQNLAGYENVPRVGHYFNSGVLLIDLVQFREQRVRQKAMEYLTKHPNTPYPDQDALNVACDGQWKVLDSRWNFQDHRFKSIAEFVAKNRIAVVHFVTSEKPWIARNLSLNAGFYDAFRDRTRFARSRWERLVDFQKGAWVRCRIYLGQWKMLRAIWRLLKGAKRVGQ